MKERLVKLIDVKSIMTLALTVVFCVLALTGVVSGQEFITIFTVIVGFYFGTQAQKVTAAATVGQNGSMVNTSTGKHDHTPQAVEETMANKLPSPDADLTAATH